ncbi:MAG: sugar transferase [Chitinophagales bacterium]
MIHTKRSGIFWYMIADWLCATFTWLIFYLFRKKYIEQVSIDYSSLLQDNNFVLAIIFLPLVWMFFYFITGTYTDIYRKSRFGDIGRTFIQTLIGVIIIFFTLLLDDWVSSYTHYYATASFLFIVHFLFTVTIRMVLLTWAKYRLHNRKYGYPTLIIGSNHEAVDFYVNHEEKHNYAYDFKGFLSINKESVNGLKNHLVHLGEVKDIESIINAYKIEEIVIAIDSGEHKVLNEIINSLSGRDLFIKIIPDIYDILSGSVKMSHIIGTPLIELYPDLMPKWQKLIKRIVDLMVSSVSLLLLLPLFAFIALKVKLSSKGDIFYKQKRVGHRGKEFDIYKFRSMYVDAEKDGPALSSEGDSRITPWGKIMRKWRLDELPQFFNVLIGDMSLIGPRPERSSFIAQMEKEAPHCKHLQRVQPGITSLGMVKYGYAENVKEMIERLKYDVIYIENMSLTMDFKIFLYTLITLMKGRGK